MFNQVDHNLDVYWKYRTFPNYLSLNEKLFKKTLKLNKTPNTL